MFISQGPYGYQPRGVWGTMHMAIYLLVASVLNTAFTVTHFFFLEDRRKHPGNFFLITLLFRAPLAVFLKPALCSFHQQTTGVLINWEVLRDNPDASCCFHIMITLINKLNRIK